VGHFQGTYTCPGNPWDLWNYRQKPNETLREYIRRFSQHYTKLPNAADASIVESFLTGTMCKELVHELVKVLV
jgi:hypothetical protein